MDDISQGVDEQDALPVTSAKSASPPPTTPWPIPRLLGTGLTILSGEPKSGKSWLALDLALAVGRGRTALRACACPAGDVIYFDMENGRQRLDARVKSLLGGRKADLSRIRFAAEPPPTGRTSVERLPPPDRTQSKRAATRCEAEPVAFSIPARARRCID